MNRRRVAAAVEIPAQRAVSPDELEVPSRHTRAHLFESGWCLSHDLPTETIAGRERCRSCDADFDAALAVMDGARDRRRG